MKGTIFDLSGRVALVTGGSKGLGKAMARGFAMAGADVVISSRHEDELKAALSEIVEGTGVRGAYFVADMTQREEVERLAKSALSEMGRVASRMLKSLPQILHVGTVIMTLPNPGVLKPLRALSPYCLPQKE